MKDEASPRVPANFADGDMKPSELAEVLAGLNFSRGASVSLELDKAVRDYLLDAIRQRHASREFMTANIAGRRRGARRAERIGPLVNLADARNQLTYINAGSFGAAQVGS